MVMVGSGQTRAAGNSWFRDRTFFLLNLRHLQGVQILQKLKAVENGRIILMLLVHKISGKEFRPGLNALPPRVKTFATCLQQSHASARAIN